MAEHRYDPQEIEPRWQALWARERTWEVSNEPQPSRAPTPRRRGCNSYVLEMLPYPSGEPHIGHLKVLLRRRRDRTLPPPARRARAAPDGL